MENIIQIISNFDGSHWTLVSVVCALLVWIYIMGKASEKAQKVVERNEEEISDLRRQINDLLLQKDVSDFFEGEKNGNKRNT